MLTESSQNCYSVLFNFLTQVLCTTQSKIQNFIIFVPVVEKNYWLKSHAIIVHKYHILLVVAALLTHWLRERDPSVSALGAYPLPLIDLCSGTRHCV